MRRAVLRGIAKRFNVSGGTPERGAGGPRVSGGCDREGVHGARSAALIWLQHMQGAPAEACMAPEAWHWLGYSICRARGGGARRAARATAGFAPVAAAFAAPALAPHAQERRIPIDQLKSGITFSAASVQGLQADDFANPGMLWVERGEKLWTERAG